VLVAGLVLYARICSTLWFVRFHHVPDILFAVFIEAPLSFYFAQGAKMAANGDEWSAKGEVSRAFLDSKELFVFCSFRQFPKYSLATTARHFIVHRDWGKVHLQALLCVWIGL